MEIVWEGAYFQKRWVRVDSLKPGTPFMYVDENGDGTPLLLMVQSHLGIHTTGDDLSVLDVRNGSSAKMKPHVLVLPVSAKVVVSEESHEDA